MELVVERKRRNKRLVSCADRVRIAARACTATRGNRAGSARVSGARSGNANRAQLGRRDGERGDGVVVFHRLARAMRPVRRFRRTRDPRDGEARARAARRAGRSRRRVRSARSLLRGVEERWTALESATDGRPPCRGRSPRARGGHLGEQVVSGSRHGLAKRRGSDTGGASPDPRASRAPGGPRGRELETDRGCGRGEERRVRLGTLAGGDRQGGRRGPDLDRARGASIVIIIIITTRNAPVQRNESIVIVFSLARPRLGRSFRSAR